MTAYQAKLIDAEILRHISMALAAETTAIKRDHMEVAQALTAALVEAGERRESQCQVSKSAHPIDSLLRRFRARKADCCLGSTRRREL